jgi:transposase
MAAIVFMTRTSTPWALLPVAEFGCGSVTTCWRRFAEWASAGVFERLQEVLLDELGETGALDWSRVTVDSFSLRAVRGGPDRRKPGRPGQERIEAARGRRGERATAGAAGDRGQHNDSVVFEALLDDLPAVRTPAGGRRCRPDNCHADKAYDHPHCRSYLARRGIKVRIARRGIESSARLGRHRWKAERTIAWLAGCRRLRVRYDRDSERFFAFAMLACARLCSNRLHAGVKGMPPGRAG